MNNDRVITSLKTKKRVRSIFSDKKKIKSSKLHKKVQQESSDSEDMLKPKEDNETKQDKTYRFEVDIKAMSSGDKYPEIFFSDLIGEQEQDNDAGALDPGDDSELQRLALHFENKYGDSKKKRVTDVQLDHGYDTSDPFVDDSEAYDEVIPDELDTQFGGFYINFGDLMFKKVEPEPENSDTEFKSKKRKRDDDEKADENKEKRTKIKSLQSRIRKELNVKKKRTIEDESEESDGSDSSDKKDKEKSSDETSQTTSCSELENKSKGLEKEITRPKEIKKSTEEVLKKRTEEVHPSVIRIRDRKVPALIETIKRTVSENKPFDKTKLHLLHDVLYCLEVEIRRNRKIARKSIYDKLCEDIPGFDDLDLKKAGLNALTKQNSENLAKDWTPLKSIVDKTMPDCIRLYNKKKAEYEVVLSSLPEDDDDELVKPKAPLRTFTWSDEIRTLFGALITTKYNQIKLLRTKSDEQEDLLKRYLNTLSEAMWPIGWMNLAVLIKEAKSFCSILNKNGKTVSKSLSVRSMSKSKPFKSDNKSKISSKLLKNAISKHQTKQDETTKASLSTIGTITKHKEKIIHRVDLSDNSPVKTKTSIIRQSSTPLHKQHITTTGAKTTTTVVPKIITTVVPKTIPISVPNTVSTVPKNSTHTVPHPITITNKTCEASSASKTVPKINNTQSSSKPTPNIPKPNPPKTSSNNSKSHPVLQLCPAKPQPRSTKLDSTITDVVLKKQIMDKLSAIHGIDVLKGIQNSPMFDEMIKQALSTSGVNQQKLHRLNISSGASSCPIVIDDEPLADVQNTPHTTQNTPHTATQSPRSTQNTPHTTTQSPRSTNTYSTTTTTPSASAATPSTTTASHPITNTTRSATIPQSTTATHSTATAQIPTTNTSQSTTTPQIPATCASSISGSPRPTTPIMTTSQPPTRLVKPTKVTPTKSKPMISHNIQSIIAKPSISLGNSLIKSPSSISSSLGKPSSPRSTSLLKPSVNPLSAILSEHSDIKITTLKSLSDAVSKLKTHDKTL